MANKLDPREVFGDGPLPGTPAPIFGWGWLPDQYRREEPDDGMLDEAD
jgi:hypothetical protein